MNRRWWCALAVVGALMGACEPVESPWTPPVPVAEPTLSFEEFERTRRGPTPGTYVVEKDILLTGIEELEAWFHRRHPTYDRVDVSSAGAPLGSQRAELNINLRPDSDCVLKEPKDCWDRWCDGMKHQLTYCVSTRFDELHDAGTRDAVVQAMASAAYEWNNAADITFRHVPSGDGGCNPAEVLFTVEPYESTPVETSNGLERVSGALAFFPSDDPQYRRLWLNWRRLRAPGEMPLRNVLLHELGHVLGFRHEHLTHADSSEPHQEQGKDWISVTHPHDARPGEDDPLSVMHYLEIGEIGTHIPEGRSEYSLSERDRQGVAHVYSKPTHASVCPIE